VARFLLKFGHLVLQLQFFSLEFNNSRIVRRWVVLLFLDFLLERLMAALEFDNVALQGHQQPPLFTPASKPAEA
jgi:hypothetical protein